jgi:jasmonate ZIM domain-containing protein
MTTRVSVSRSGNNPDDDLNEEEVPAKRMDAGGSGERLEDVPDALWLRL